MDIWYNKVNIKIIFGKDSKNICEANGRLNLYRCKDKQLIKRFKYIDW